MRFSTICIGGPEPGFIVIVDYDPAWPRRYERERRRIATALGSTASIIEHIGSTSVPGLASKPVIDVLVAVDDVERETSYREQLQAAGYVLRVREPGHRMFRTHEKSVHVHVWSEPQEIDRHLAFRNWLRANEDDRKLYEKTKRELAKREWDDTNQYAEAKDGVIAQIMARAR